MRLLTSWASFPQLAALILLCEAVLSLAIIRFINCTYPARLSPRVHVAWHVAQLAF
jgi:hypothetical protein